jgi:hypothetical protein
MATVTIKGYIEGKPKKCVLQYSSEFVPRAGESLKHGTKELFIQKVTYIIDKELEVHIVISKQKTVTTETPLGEIGHIEVKDDTIFSDEEWDNQ